MLSLRRCRPLARVSSVPLYTKAAFVHLNALDSERVPTRKDLPIVEKSFLDSALRVDQAGEIAANYIYKGQMSVLGNDPSVRVVLQEMWDQEKKHLGIMDDLLQKYRVRPTVLVEIAKVAGFSLGYVTALLGKEAAMACTEAVETVIGEHYDDQMKEISALNTTHLDPKELVDTLRQLRDDELEHLDIAVEQLSQRAPAHAFLSYIIGEGCKVAIEICKRY